MKGTIELNGMKFHAFHGCLEQERREGNLFVVDVKFSCEMEDAAVNDDLSGTVDYSAVYDIVAAQMAQPSKLLENVAWRIRKAIEEKIPQIEDLRVCVAKKNPPVGGSVEWSKVTL